MDYFQLRNFNIWPLKFKYKVTTKIGQSTNLLARVISADTIKEIQRVVRKLSHEEKSAAAVLPAAAYEPVKNVIPVYRCDLITNRSFNRIQWRTDSTIRTFRIFLQVVSIVLFSYHTTSAKNENGPWIIFNTSIPLDNIAAIRPTCILHCFISSLCTRLRQILCRNQWYLSNNLQNRHYENIFKHINVIMMVECNGVCALWNQHK